MGSKKYETNPYWSAGIPTLAGELMLSSITPPAQVGWYSSSWVMVSLGQISHVTFLPFYEPVPLPAHSALIQSVICSGPSDITAGEPLERLGKWAAPIVQLLMLAAQPKIG